MTEQNSTKSYVNENGNTTILCPECYKKKTLAVEKFRGKKTTLKAKCSCGHIFVVNLEFRRHYRKPTELNGKYKMDPPSNSAGISEIINLSLSGACFKVRGMHDIQEGQLGTIEFTLDNRKQTSLFKHVIIRNVDKGKIGCEFLDQQAFNKELGFYLRN